MYYTWVESPIGRLLLISNGDSLTGLYMTDPKHAEPIQSDWHEDTNAQPFPQTRKQLEEYFQGKRKEFDLPIELRGTNFQKRVWQALSGIPFGITISYKQLAMRIGNPASVRAVGQANGNNPVSLIVPCHRVIGADGSLTGYGGGIERKAALLEFEQAVTVNGPGALEKTG